MNIFAVDEDPEAAARALVDKHVVKMPLETAQILSTAVRERGHADDLTFLYDSTHSGHPCVRWAGASPANFAWTLRHGLALGREYAHRYEDSHKSVEEVLKPLRDRTTLPDCNGHTPFAQAMPEAYQDPEPVTAYRQYYRGEKIPEMGSWTNRDPPVWRDVPEPGVTEVAQR